MQECLVRPLHPDVAIVVLNWNGIAHTRRCLDSLRDLRYPGHVSVVVVDNGSDGSESDILTVEYPEAFVLGQPQNLGYGDGCNVGIAWAQRRQRPYILLLNNDAHLPPDALFTLVDFMEETPDAGAVSPLILFDDSRLIWSAGGKISTLTGSAIMQARGQARNALTHSQPYPVQFAPGACLLLRLSTIEAVGLLNGSYFAYWEDVDLCFRIRDSGWRCYVIPSAIAFHAKSASTGKPGDQPFSRIAAYYLARNAFQFGRQRMRGPRKAVFLFAQIVSRGPYMLLFRMAKGSRASYVAGAWDGARGRSGEYRVGRKG